MRDISKLHYYLLADGRRLTLAYYEPDEWATVMEARLLAQGCSQEYALSEANAIRGAQPTAHPTG